MKTPFLLSLALSLLCISAKAQLSFGIKSGSTKAWLTDVNETYGKTVGMGITFQFSKKFNKVLEIGIEPGIVQRGTNANFGEHSILMCCFGDCYEFESIFDPNANSLISSYLQMPLMAKVHLPTQKGIFDLYGKIGGGPSWLASGSYDTQSFNVETFNYDPERKNIEFTEDHPFHRWDWGAYAGIGLGLKVGTGQVFVESEWYRGFTKVVDYNSFKNRTRSYSLGYQVNW